MLSLYHTATIHEVSLNLTNLMADSAGFFVRYIPSAHLCYRNTIYFGRIVFWKQIKWHSCCKKMSQSHPQSVLKVLLAFCATGKPNKPMFVLGVLGSFPISLNTNVSPDATSSANLWMVMHGDPCKLLPFANHCLFSRSDLGVNHP